MKKKKIMQITSAILFAIFLIFSQLWDINFGREVRNNFMNFSIDLMKFLPFIFLLIGLFEVWVKRETVEKHLGKGGGINSYIWAVLLGSTTVGAMIVALPVALTLYGKGARLSIVLTYVCSAAVCRIPMTIFEISFLGLNFTIVRLLVTIPLFLLIGIITGSILKKRDYQFKNVE